MFQYHASCLCLEILENCADRSVIAVMNYTEMEAKVRIPATILRATPLKPGAPYTMPEAITSPNLYNLGSGSYEQ